MEQLSDLLWPTWQFAALRVAFFIFRKDRPSSFSAGEKLDTKKADWKAAAAAVPAVALFARVAADVAACQ